MFERFTDEARKVMSTANEQAQQFGNGYIDTGHILSGLVKESGGTGAIILKDLDVNIDKLSSEVEQIPKSREDKERPLQSEGAVNVIKYAIEEARVLEHNYIGSEHILLGLLRETDGVAAKILTNLDIKLEDVRQKAKERRPNTWKN